MDFIRHDVQFFYANNTFDRQDEQFVRFKNTFDNVRTVFECFSVKGKSFEFKAFHNNHNNHNNNNNHNKVKKSFIVQNDDTMLLYIRSQLNKLTYNNFTKIYHNVSTKLTTTYVEGFVQLVLSICSQSTLYTDLHISLLLYVYANKDQHSKDSIVKVVNAFYVELFHADYYLKNEKTLKESYDEFCDRVKDQKKMVQHVKSYFLFCQDKEFAQHMRYTPNFLVRHMFECLEKMIEEPSEHENSIEQSLNCLIECFTMHPTTLKLPCTHSDVYWKKLICFDSSTIEDFHRIVYEFKQLEHTTYKLKFKCLDFITLLDRFNND